MIGRIVCRARATPFRTAPQPDQPAYPIPPNMLRKRVRNPVSDTPKLGVWGALPEVPRNMPFRAYPKFGQFGVYPETGQFLPSPGWPS